MARREYGSTEAQRRRDELRDGDARASGRRLPRGRYGQSGRSQAASSARYAGQARQSRAAYGAGRTGLSRYRESLRSGRGGRGRSIGRGSSAARSRSADSARWAGAGRQAESRFGTGAEGLARYRESLRSGRGGGGGASGDITIEDLLSQLGGGGGGVDPYAAAAAGAYANSVGSAPTIDIASALAPYDQAKAAVGTQAESAAAELARISSGRDQDRQLAASAARARLEQLQAAQAASQQQIAASTAADSAAAARDLQAQGVDGGYAAASAGARTAGNDQLAAAAAAQLQAERAASDRSMLSTEQLDAEQAWTGQSNLAFNRDTALMEIATARAAAEAQLKQAQEQLNADYAQRQADAQLQAAGMLADGQQAGMDLQGGALDLLSQLGGDAYLYPERDAVRRDLVAYDGGEGKLADDLFNQVASVSGNMDEFLANLEVVLSEQDALERSDGRATPRQWDRNWFRQNANRWYQQGGIDPEVANMILLRLTGQGGAFGGGANSIASQPFGGMRPMMGPY